MMTEAERERLVRLFRILLERDEKSRLKAATGGESYRTESPLSEQHGRWSAKRKGKERA